MNEIRLRGYRCFRDEQSARMAPLTLLVGENSTGKTSFLALIRALWDLGYLNTLPDFKEKPYDLGSFDEIAHHRGARGSRADSFEVGFTAPALRWTERGRPTTGKERSFDFTFSKKRNQPALASERIQQEDMFIELDLKRGKTTVGTKNGSWSHGLKDALPAGLSFDEHSVPISWFFLLQGLISAVDAGNGAPETDWTSPEGAGAPSEDDRKGLQALIRDVSWPRFQSLQRPFASAPVRSKPRRTYDPSRVTSDPEGAAVPMYLADASYRDRREWSTLHTALEEFGRASGLFDEIRVRRLGKTSEPFQIQVRKSGSRRLKGPWRNLTDVGYGVSQVLPVITELLRTDAPGTFLLQQPEVHLHPSAQAALGSLFCAVAARDKQLIVETHGDHLIDRVRMDVRDGRSGLKPDQVSILYFEREELEVRIHPLRIDENGNILGAPPSYRRFFMEETNRSIGL